MDYENANERKFLLLVEAKEPNGRLSSTATVTVEVIDLNDNAPEFPKDSYTAIGKKNKLISPKKSRNGSYIILAASIRSCTTPIHFNYLFNFPYTI